MSDIDYTTIEDGELLKWEKTGIKIEGQLVNYNEQRDTGKGIGHVYEVKTKDSIVPFFAPSLLHKKLRNIKLGDVVRIKFVKVTKTGSGNDLKHFDVGHADPTDANLAAVGIVVLKNVEGDDSDEEIDADKM